MRTSVLFLVSSPSLSLFLLPLLCLQLFSSPARAQTNEERARFLYEAANRAIEKRDWVECVDSLERAQKALGRKVLKLQAPLVRCHYELQAWADVVAAAQTYYKLEGADPKLQEYQNIGAMLVEAEKHLEKQRAGEAERAEAARLVREKEERKLREQQAAALAERQRLQRDEERRIEQQRREREAYLAGAPARKAEHLAQANQESSTALGMRLWGLGLFGAALVAATGGAGAFLYGIAGLADVNATEDEGLFALGALVVGLAAMSFAGWLGFDAAPDEFSGAEVHDVNADAARARAAEEDALITGSAP